VTRHICDFRKARTYGQSCTVRTFAGEARQGRGGEGIPRERRSARQSRDHDPGLVCASHGTRDVRDIRRVCRDAARQAHLAGDIARTLMAEAPRLLAETPKIEMVDVLAAKLPAG